MGLPVLHLSEDISPVDYLKSMKKHYLHELANSSFGMRLDASDLELQESALSIGMETGRHYLILSGLTGKMCCDEGKNQLSALLQQMEEVWIMRHNMDSEIYDKIDRMYLTYSDLECHIKGHSSDD